MAPLSQPTLNLQHERVDDIPLLVGVLQQLRLPELLDRHLGAHHLHQGLRNGSLATAWIAFLLSEANHCKVSVQDWAQRHAHTLEALLGQSLRPVEFSDDRLGIVLRRLHQADWPALEGDLWQGTCEVYQIPVDGVRLDSTTTFGYHEVTAEGLLQFGHSKDHRPDLPQLKLMAAVAQPTGHGIACDIVPGNAADDPLYLPLIDRVRGQLKQKGLLYMGDCKMAALATRADLADHGDYYLTVLPRTGEDATLIEAWIEEAVTNKDGVQPLSRAGQDDQPEVFARAYPLLRSCVAEVAGQTVCWDERVQLVRTEALAEHHAEQLERRLREAEAEVWALTPPVGRGRRQQREEAALAAAVAAVLERHEVEDLLRVRWQRETYGAKGGTRPGRKEAQVRYQVTAVKRDEAAIEARKERQAWRVQVTNLPAARCDLLASVLLYNGGWSVERGFHLLKDKPLGIQPLYVREEDQVDGLTKLLMIALRVLTFLEVVMRGRLAESAEELVGLYEGQPKRRTGQPTAVRLLRAVTRMEITLTQIEAKKGTRWWLTPLPPLLERILALLGVSQQIYTGLAGDTG
jgi:transposase